MNEPQIHALADYAHLEPGSIRDGFGKGLLAAGQANQAVVALCADLTESTRVSYFANQFPERFVEVGVAEQNLVGIAAGLALGGKTPFAVSYAEFNPGRSWEQIRVSVCYSNLNVKLVGGHAGLSVGPDGATHQALEDLALTQVLPNLTVIVPCDEQQAYQATLAAAKHSGPIYLRLSRDTSARITTQQTDFKIGKGQLLRAGTDLTIVATGLMVAQALLAADQLAAQDISAQVINIHTLKPIDTELLIWAAKTTGAIVTAEEHQKLGGLGSTVASVLAEQLPTPLAFVAVQDAFGESGTTSELFEKYQLNSASIITATHSVLKRKKTHAHQK